MASGITALRALLSNKVISGNRSTTASNVRDFEREFIDSSLNIVDGGLVVQALAGYSSILIPTDDKHWTPKKWVLDQIASSTPTGVLFAANNLSDVNNASTARTNLGLVIGTNVQAWSSNLDSWSGIGTGSKLSIDGSISMTGDLDLNSHDIKRVSNIKDTSNVISLVPSTRLLKDSSGNTIANWQSQSVGFGIITGSFAGFFKTTNISGSPKTLEFPNQNGTIAITSDLNDYLPLSGGTLSGNLDLGGNNTINVNLIKVNDGGGIYNTSINAQINLQASGNITFAATGINSNTVPYFDSSNNLISSLITPTELGYLSGTSSNIQGQIDALISGLSWKQAVRVATTANITLSGTQTIDGVSVNIGDRVLVKDQSTASQNGIYLCASGSWTRTTDLDSASEFPSATVAISEGTTNADKQYVCTNDLPITIGTTAITWVLVGGTTYVGTTSRITVTGNVIDISASYVGQSSITTLGTIGTGIWQGTAIADSYISSASTWNAKVSSQWVTSGSDIYYSTGGVMIGQSSTPSAKLHTVDTGTSSPRGIIADQYNTGTNSSQYNLRKARGTFASPSTIVVGDILSNINSWAHDGSNFINASAIRVTSVGTIGTGRTPTKMGFYTMTDVTTGVLTLALELDQSQNAAFSSAININGTGGLGYLGIVSQSTKPGTPSSGFRLFADSSNRFAWIGTNGYVRTFDGTALTQDVTITIPNISSGTMAVVDSNGNISNLIQPYEVYAEGVTNKDYTLDAKSNLSWTLTQIRGLKTSSGTCTIAIKINGTAVTWTGSVTTLSVSSVAQDVSIISGGTFNRGDRIIMTITSAASPADLEFTLI